MPRFLKQKRFASFAGKWLLFLSKPFLEAMRKKISCVRDSISYRTTNCHCPRIRSVFLMQMAWLLMLRRRQGETRGCKCDTRGPLQFPLAGPRATLRVTKPCPERQLYYTVFLRRYVTVAWDAFLKSVSWLMSFLFKF